MGDVTIVTRRRVSTGRRRGQDNEWVSKTDLTRYLRCPYSFWLLSTGQIGRGELVDDLGAQLIAEGTQFDKSLREASTPVDVQNVQELFTEDIRVFRSQRFENPTLQIAGIPDGIDTADGALVPIEVKSHKVVQKSDRLELAFYWLLLEPLRTRGIEPRGVLLLRDGESSTPIEVEIDLTAHLLDEVRRLILEVRRTRNAKEILPQICDCPYCRAHQAEIDARTPRSDLTRIWGIRRKYASHLQSIGIVNQGLLKGCDPILVAESMKARQWGVSPRVVESWIRHVESYERGATVVFEVEEIPASYIALDLEYLPSHVWLVGGCVVDDQSRTDFAWWADSDQEEASNLDRLRKLVALHPTKPLVTWAGLSADFPQLRQALARCGGDDGFLEDHVDLYQLVCRSMRLPIASLSLKDVSKYFGLERVSEVSGGMEAQFLYHEYVGAKRRRKKQLKIELLAYNKDDIDTLVKTAELLRSLYETAAG